ncbi:MAG: hypothetical protein EOP86_16685 [Verrucomicrobiaceae bacterium]|nr:MAG: hypothetical protein EOP86_16685 [Verrucomicrobiaceae bacterium]
MSKKQSVGVDGRELILTNLDKVLFPECGFTKGEVIGYYAAVAETILPHLAGRPLTLKRFPDGVEGEFFYERNAPAHTPDWVERFTATRSGGEAVTDYLLCNDRATLLWTTNLGDIEKHVLPARVPNLDCPTSMVFDLDPGEPATLIDCCRTALHLKGLFETLGLQCFPKVSGSKGLHLSVPLNTPASYEVVQPFAETVARLVTRQLPDSVVSEMGKTLRRGKVLIDWSQNSDFKTTVCVYAMRAKHGEPFISMPVTWEEVNRAAKKAQTKGLLFTPKAAIRRIGRMGDLFKPVLTLRQELPEAFTEAIGVRSSKKPRGAKGVRDKSLREYESKRDHARTPEPEAASKSRRRAADSGAHRFVIQKHDASHTHYDFRLEMEGVLRSWAVPKGPPAELRQTRLAMHVEDHPLAYENFEGIIPEGNYGAGTVMVWDRGTYEDQTGDPAAAFHAGKLHLTLSGKKLRGEWILVKDRRDGEGNRWLLIKAGESMAPLSAKRDDTSVISGRSMGRISTDSDTQWEQGGIHSPPPKKRAARKKTVSPSFIEPMQCQLVTDLPEGEEWTYELKFDGYRCLAVKAGRRASLISRNGKSLNARFPALVKAMRSLEGGFLIDGEVAALDAEGRPSFQLLQNSRGKNAGVFFYAFDLLHADGESLMEAAFSERRARLEAFLGNPGDPVRLSPVLPGTAEQVIQAVRQTGLEGVIAKRRDSVYEAGERTGAWVKYRTSPGQEFVIGGYVPGTRGFDSLLIGVFEGKELMYCAKLRNGFVPRVREEIFTRLQTLVTAECPFANLPEPRSAAAEAGRMTAAKMRECRWVRPEVVCQAAFASWTDRGRLRHVSFAGLRDDKPAMAVVREGIRE